MKKIKKQAILLTLTLILILFACNAVSAADNSNNVTQSNNISTKLSAANPTAAAMNSAPSKVVISGKVLKCSDGTPFSGVTVTAFKGGTKLASTTTGSDGTYTLSFLSSDDVFNVTASYPGHVSSSKNVAVTSGAYGTSCGTANFQLGYKYVYVNGTGGSDSNDGSSWNKAVRSIKHAVSLIDDGVTGYIYLASGYYDSSDNYHIYINGNKNVTIEGNTGNADDVTIIPWGKWVFEVQGRSSLTLQDLTIKQAGQLAAITNYGTCTITDCTFMANTASTGGAINNGGYCTISNCNFVGNTASTGGAIYNTGTCTITDCTFTGNSATTGGAIYNGGTLTVTSSIFKNNSVNTAITNGDGAAIYTSGTCNVISSTFSNNKAQSGAIYNSYNGNLDVKDSTFTDNTATAAGGAIETYGTSCTVSNCTFTGNSAGNGGAICIRTAATINYSTFINNGINGGHGGAIYDSNSIFSSKINFCRILNNSGTDVYSDVANVVDATNNWWGTNLDPKSVGRINDKGNADPWILLNLTASPTFVNPSSTSTITAYLRYNSAGTNIWTSYGEYIPDDEISLTCDSLGHLSSTRGFMTYGLFDTIFTAGSKYGDSEVNATIDGQTVKTTIKIKDMANVYVATDGNDDTGDGSLTAPFQSLAKAISEVKAGGTVHVAKGNYNGANNRGISIGKNVNIVGESQNSVIINAEGSNWIFAISNGMIVTIQNLTLTHGGLSAISNSGTLNLSNCTFTNSTSSRGGAIFNSRDTCNINGCTFTNNTATNDGGAIYVYGGKVNIYFSRIVGNTAHTGSAIYVYDGYGGSVNAENNWWGSNNPVFSSLVNGTVDYSPWIVLNITSNTATVKKGGSAAITVNMLYDSDGNYHNPASGHVPDGTDVSFTGTRGSLNPTGSTLIDGQAASVFTANAAGAAVVFAAVDDEIVSTSINVNKANTGLIVSNAAGVNGKAVNLTVTLADENGNPVDSEIVNFNVNGNGHSATTDSSGVATWSYPITETAGIYTVNANFAGDDNYILSSGTGSLTINTKDTTLIVGNVTGVNGKTVNLTATLTDADGPVSGENVTFHVNGKDYTVKTNASGVATWSYPITEIAGIYTITAGFVDGTIYANSSGTGKLTVNTINTTITLNNATGYNGKTVNLTATLKDENGNPVSGKTVTFTVNGTDYTATTDASGLAAFSYKLTKAGVYNVSASFSDGAVYANSTGSGNLTVSPAANLYIKITSSNNNPEVGEKFLLTYKLGNYGPDAAENVTITFKLPEGLDFVKVTADTGNCTYDPSTRIVTWTLDSVPVGDPYLYFTVKAAGDGTYKITPGIDSATYNSGSSGDITINVQAPSSNSNSNGSGNSGSSTVNAASTISMQKTGVPLNYLILAIFMVISGLIVPKRK